MTEGETPEGKLTRENATLRAQLAEAERTEDEMIEAQLQMMRQRDEARAQLAEAQAKHDGLLYQYNACHAEKDEARALARRLREMAHPVDEDDGKALAAYDTASATWPP